MLQISLLSHIRSLGIFYNSHYRYLMTKPLQVRYKYADMAEVSLVNLFHLYIVLDLILQRGLNKGLS